MISYAYVHCKPDGVPFYVGKGTLRRARYLGERNLAHQATVKEHGRKNILAGVLECSDASTAYALEIGLIKCLKRMGVHLTNLTAGGDGGAEPGVETRKRLSAAAKKRGVSEACHTARVLAKTGVPLSAKTKEKLASALRGRIFTTEHKQNISKSAKKRGMAREIMAAAWATNLGRVKSAEERAKHAAGAKTAWAAKRSKARVA